MTTVQLKPASRASSVPGRRHLPALDGLRGVAILGVLLFHAGHLGGGFLGVDLFFALSGYLITDLLLREVGDTGSVSLVGFWGRRVRRLVPALAVMLVVVTVVVWGFGAPDLVRSTLSDGPWTQADLVNWHLLAESASYWDSHDAPRVFEHLWSIAVEEQFYVVWPVVVLLIAEWARRTGRRAEQRDERRVERRVDGQIEQRVRQPDKRRMEQSDGLPAQQRVERWVAASALVISLLSLVLMIALVDPNDPTRVYTGTDTRAFSLLLGAVVATRPVREALARVVGRRGGAVAGVLVVGIAVAWYFANGTGSHWLYAGGLFGHSLAAALLIGLCVQVPGSVVARVLGWSPLRWVGQISYSLYLWHWPVFVFLSPQRLHVAGWTWIAVVCAVSVGLAAASKYLVEDPIRFRAGWARGRGGLVAFVALMVGLAVLWWALPAPAAPAIDITRLG
ncbi:acyltransferase family protein [Catenulispora pinisilvae]|uniref:acyltransferase family protein n=1 Tax=Catenulispora pinisilvae TaxID=2705253 RepID=UPI0018922038